MGRMKLLISRCCKLFIFVVLCLSGSLHAEESSGGHSSLLIVVDDLRPEMVTRSAMPNLRVLSRKGVFLQNHRAVYPPVATVNAASVVTGAYPKNHGILGGGNQRSITLPTLGEFMTASDQSLLIVSSASPKVARLLGTAGGTYISAPEEGLSLIERDEWVVDKYLETPGAAELTILWLGNDGGGAGESGDDRRRLGGIDAGIGRILKAHRKRDAAVNVFVTSSGNTLSGAGEVRNVSQLLIDNGLKESTDSKDVYVADDVFVYVEGHNLDRIREIVVLFQQTPWVGAVYTQQVRKTHPEGKAAGSLSFQSVYLDHERAPDILVEPAWRDEEAPNGLPGVRENLGASGGATSSAYALRAPLIAAGPDIKSNVDSRVPSANSDLAPTLGYLLGLPRSTSMDGRVLHEILAGGQEPDDVDVLRRRHGSQVELVETTYRLMMSEFTVDGVEYMGSARVERIQHK